LKKRKKHKQPIVLNTVQISDDNDGRFARFVFNMLCSFLLLFLRATRQVVEQFFGSMSFERWCHAFVFFFFGGVIFLHSMTGNIHYTEATFSSRK